MVAVKDHVEWMIKAADDAGFEIAWAAEHHALEMTIAPNPFQIMMWWAGITQKMRLGCGWRMRLLLASNQYCGRGSAC